MNLYMVSIYDKRAQEFAPPMCQHTLGTAERTFQDIACNPESPVNKHPEDYELHHVGMYDTETGAMEAVKPVRIVSALQLVPTKM